MDLLPWYEKQRYMQVVFKHFDLHFTFSLRRNCFSENQTTHLDLLPHKTAIYIFFIRISYVPHISATCQMFLKIRSTERCLFNIIKRVQVSPLHNMHVWMIQQAAKQVRKVFC